MTAGAFETVRSGAAAPVALDESLARGVQTLGIALPDGAQAALLAYLTLLGKWNRTYNLTAIREPERMVTHHLLDALAALPTLERLAAGPVHVLDVGSGAGLPGVPLAVARPGWRITMLEPVTKKSAFITQAIAELGLANAHALASRVEDAALEVPATLVVSRAFADLASFAKSGLRHLAPGGRLVAMKGVYPHEELADLPRELAATVVPVQVPGLDAARHLVVLEPVAR